MELLNDWKDWWRTRPAIRDLAGIIALEIEALRAYDDAISRIGLPGPADQLAQFRNEHAMHLEQMLTLNRRIGRRFGEKVLSSLRVRHPGFQGLVVTDHTEEAMREILEIEERSWRAWAGYAGLLPKAIAGFVHRFREDEQRHLRFVRSMIDRRIWELGDTQPETP